MLYPTATGCRRVCRSVPSSLSLPRTLLSATWLRLSRRWHRWGAWGLSVIVLMWTVTGLMMIWPSAPEAPRTQPVARLEVTDDLISPAGALASFGDEASQPLLGLALRNVGGKLYWALTFGRGTRLVDARSGARFEMADSIAARIAVERLGALAEPEGVTRLARSDNRYRGAFPAWRVTFRDAAAYVGPDGSVTVASTAINWKNAAGLLHAFNVPRLTSGRSRLRLVLLVVASAGTLALIGTGLVLLFPLRRGQGSAGTAGS